VEEVWKTTFTCFEESPLTFLRRNSGKPKMLHSIVVKLNKVGYSSYAVVPLDHNVNTSEPKQLKQPVHMLL
jgi:hypothetical protein